MMRKQLPQEFLQKLRDLEFSYLAESDPILQSGFSGGAFRWRNERRLILDAVEGDGDFLDAGCANGYLLECLVIWAREKGITLIPYGLDYGAGLIDLARKRLPQYAKNFWVGNAWDWIPPRKFRFVYTLHHCVPNFLLGEYTKRLFERVVESDGRLIMGAYGSRSQNLPARDIATELKAEGFTIAGTTCSDELPVSRVVWISADRISMKRL